MVKINEYKIISFRYKGMVYNLVNNHLYHGYNATIDDIQLSGIITRSEHIDILRVINVKTNRTFAINITFNYKGYNVYITKFILMRGRLVIKLRKFK